MEITETLSQGLKREYKVLIGADTINKKIDEKLLELSKKAKIDGFRAGKIPLNVMKKRYGDSAKAEVVEQLIPEQVRKAIEEKKLTPAISPDVELISFEGDLEFKMSLEVLPEIPELDFSKIELKKPVHNVTDEELDELIEKVSQMSNDYKTVEREAGKDDQVVIDFIGKIGGVAFEGGQAEDHSLVLGSNTFIEGFEDQLIGKKAGDEVEVNVTFPENYQAEHLKGKPAVFEVKVKEVQEPAESEINDELAKKRGYESLADMREQFSNMLQKKYEETSKKILTKKLFDHLEKEYSFELPEKMVKKEFEAIWEQLKHSPEFKEKDEEDLKKEYHPIAERRVKLGIILSEIGRRNEIKIEQQDIIEAVTREIQALPPQYQQQAFDYYRNNHNAMEHIKGAVMENKAVEFVLDKISLEEKEVSKDEINELETNLDKSDN